MNGLDILIRFFYTQETIAGKKHFLKQKKESFYLFLFQKTSFHRFF